MISNIQEAQEFLEQFFIALLCDADAPMSDREKAQSYLTKVWEGN